ncbi:hypothetical protein SDC9_170859 [bioreactor metagenome]|uniref:Uncharacterized protein n=1 Tax=bioreactor metagenome TaxID=1076179 RepID=A0A645G983_9ZZZZ
MPLNQGVADDILLIGFQMGQVGRQHGEGIPQAGGLIRHPLIHKIIGAVGLCRFLKGNILEIPGKDRVLIPIVPAQFPQPLLQITALLFILFFRCLIIFPGFDDVEVFPTTFSWDREGRHLLGSDIVQNTV